MTNTETHVKIKGRAMNISVEGLEALEIVAIAGQVEERMKRIEENTKIVDGSKLAILAAFEFATELYNLKQKSEVSSEAGEKKLDELAARLEKVMEK